MKRLVALALACRRWRRAGAGRRQGDARCGAGGPLQPAPRGADQLHLSGDAKPGLAAGFALTAVQGSYRKLSGGSPVSLQLRIEYQDVSGFLLPKRLHVMSHDGRAVGLMDLGFGTCQAQHR